MYANWHQQSEWSVVSDVQASARHLMKELGERAGGNFDKPSAARLAGERPA